MKLPNKPNDICPKCGDYYGFLYSKPTYRSQWDIGEHSEWLEWACTVCGYIILTQTTDNTVHALKVNV